MTTHHIAHQARHTNYNSWCHIHVEWGNTGAAIALCVPTHALVWVNSRNARACVFHKCVSAMYFELHTSSGYHGEPLVFSCGCHTSIDSAQLAEHHVGMVMVTPSSALHGEGQLNTTKHV